MVATKESNLAQWKRGMFTIICIIKPLLTDAAGLITRRSHDRNVQLLKFLFCIFSPDISIRFLVLILIYLFLFGDASRLKSAVNLTYYLLPFCGSGTALLFLYSRFQSKSRGDPKNNRMWMR
jgi:hypothetical protein